VGRHARQYHGQHGGDESISMHGLFPDCQASILYGVLPIMPQRP
jgi:hypothetical protein